MIHSSSCRLLGRESKQLPLTFSLSMFSPLLACLAAPRLIPSPDLSSSSRHLPLTARLTSHRVPNRGLQMNKPQTLGLPPDLPPSLSLLVMLVLLS